MPCSTEVKWYGSSWPAGQRYASFSRQVCEVLLHKTAFSPRSGCLRFGQRHRDAGLNAGFDLLAVEVAAVRNHIERVDVEDFLRQLRHTGELGAVIADVDHLVGDDQMVL